MRHNERMVAVQLHGHRLDHLSAAHLDDAEAVEALHLALDVLHRDGARLLHALALDQRQQLVDLEQPAVAVTLLEAHLDEDAEHVEPESIARGEPVHADLHAHRVELAEERRVLVDFLVFHRSSSILKVAVISCPALRRDAHKH